MKLFIALAAFLFLGSCNKSSSKQAFAPDPTNGQQSPPTPASPQPSAPDTTANLASLPEVSFVWDEFVTDGTNEIYLELQLSKPSDTQIEVDVDLLDGTAAYPSDFGGFKMCSDKLKQHVVFAPQQTHVDLLPIKIWKNRSCMEFTAQIQPAEETPQVLIMNNTTRIVWPCW